MATVEDAPRRAEIRTQLLRALKRERLHVERGALAASPLAVRRRFAHAWAPADLLLEHMAAWPVGLLAYWLAAPAGHVVFSASPSAYLPESIPWRERTLQAVARLALADLLGDGRPAFETLAHLVDHILGSRGAAGGQWLSDGSGANSALAQVAGQLAALARLAYGPGEPHAYFAWAFAGYWLDRPALNVADPHVERTLRTSLCSERFWSSS